jgi:hypothetical protein
VPKKPLRGCSESVNFCKVAPSPLRLLYMERLHLVSVYLPMARTSTIA